MNVDDQTHTAQPQLPPRPVNSHKGDFGHALLVGGSRGMAGAIALAGRATLRSGAGLVTLAVPQCVLDVVASFEPSYMTRGLSEDNGHIAGPAATELLALAKIATVVAIGPGLGRDAPLTQLVARLYREIEKPMVVDADGLFALAESMDVLDKPGGMRVLTPHPGEFARFTRERPTDNRRTEAAAELALRDSTSQTIVLLKGQQTVVTDGRRYSVNHTGNPGMATGGAGDVLTGIITGLLCQGLGPFEAARLGAHVHGLAGDLAADDLGQVSMIAGDVIDYLPMAFQALTQT
jgi:ADP-dependent NAD(P)H-hydrate dehydratase